MKVVKNNPDTDKQQIEKNREANENALKTYLYRKEMAESYNQKLTTGLSIYTERYEEIKDSVLPADKVEALELLQKLEDLSVEHRNNKESYEFFERKIDELMKGSEEHKFDPEQFKALKEEAEKMAEHELYESTAFLPADSELPMLIKKYQEGIEVLEARIEELGDSTSTKDQVELFELTQQVLCDKKIHARKVDYYENTFLPQYKKDMEQYDKYFEQYMSRAKVLSKYPFDPRLNEMLKKYNSGEHSKQYTWQFWTALKMIIDNITMRLSQNDPKMLPEELKGYQRLIIAE